MKTREPFGLGAVLTDYLRFLGKRAHLVLGIWCLQVLVLCVGMAILGLFEFETIVALRNRSLVIVFVVPFLMISAYALSVSRWRQQVRIGWRSLVRFQIQGSFLRILFAICAIALTVALIYGLEFSLRAIQKNSRILISVIAGFAFLPVALGPLYLKDLFPNPWAATWLCIKNMHRLAAGSVVFTILNIIISLIVFSILNETIGSLIVPTFTTYYSPDQNHLILLRSSMSYLLFHSAILLQLIAAAFLFERFKEITYGRDLSHVADAF